MGRSVLRPYRAGGLVVKCLLCRGCVDNLFGGGVPVKAFAGPVGVAGHHGGDGVGEAVVDGGVGLLARAKALEPVGEVGKIFVAHASGRELFVAGKEDVFGDPLFVDVEIVFVIANFADELPAGAAFAAGVKHGSLFAHDAGEAGRVVAKAGAIAGEEALRIGEQSLECVGVLTAVVPGED